MKISIILAAIFCLMKFEAYSQDISSSDFYKAFYKYFYFKNYYSYKDKIPQFHSIKLISNTNGLITKWEISTSTDSILAGSINRALNLMDEKQLRISDYKNCTMILPFIILMGSPRLINHEMWNYRSDDNTDSKRKERLLPPLVMFMDFSKMIDN
ncbi:hypothetical protein SAMN05421813_108155 [Daejeonella rubra]|uniref:Uncharacterized protein n=2 Tax=Daejeonella rubra TaxID=990371 RepID=A0A1G9RTM4_9SPHI|nr:hypothetical protein SAMN05421813_108155 [Daejeonella rubra]